MSSWNKQIVFGDALAQLDDFRLQAMQADALLAIFAENERLAVLQVDDVIRFHFAVGSVEEGIAVEDVAVLINLDESSAFMMSGPFENARQVLDVHVHRAGDERRLGTEREAQGRHRIVH